MRRIQFTVPGAFDGRKIVHFLREAAGCSAGQVGRLKKYPDGILLNGVHARTIDKLKAGDTLAITLRETLPVKETAASGEAEILYEDEDLIVFNKPADMPCHQSRGHQTDTLANAFMALTAKRNTPLVFRALNRLDRNTTGAVAVAKNAYAAAALTGKLHKEYLAVVTGRLTPENGVIEVPILRPYARDIRRIAAPGGQPARTVYETLETFAQCSLVRCTLPTGRTHQIRVHMRHLGHPLLGDTLYGEESGLIGRQALHCAKLVFCTPLEKKDVTVCAPFPKDMQKLFDTLRKS